MFILYFLFAYFLFKFLVYFINNKTSNDFDVIANHIKQAYDKIKQKYNSFKG